MSALLEESFDPPSAAGPSTTSYTDIISPLPTFQLRRAIGGTETELLVQTYGDRVLVVVTQNGKMGVVTQASLPPTIPLPLPAPPPPSLDDTSDPLHIPNYPPPPPALRLTPLLGTAPSGLSSPEVYSTYTAQIATLVFWTLQESQAPRRPVVVSLALQRSTHEQEEDEEEEDIELERTRFGGIMDMVAAWPGP